jgi:hypothetical protein
MVKIIARPGVPENTQAYGIEVENYFLYKTTRQTGFRVFMFPKDTLGLIVELGGGWNEALVLIDEKIFIVSLFFIRPISTEITTDDFDTFMSCSFTSSADTE